MKNECVYWVVIMAVMLSLSACGSSQTAGIDRGGGIGDDDWENQKVAVASGAINGFGSVILAGRRFDTSDASFERYGVAASEWDFAVGDTVSIVGRQNAEGELRAEQVVFEPLLSGRVQAFDEINGVITVLKQKVQLSPETFLHGQLDAFDLVGEDVTVSGWSNNDTISATGVARVSSSVNESALMGYVEQLDAQANRFNIGALNVDFTNIAEVPELSNGSWISVSGEYRDGVIVASSLVLKQLPVSATYDVSYYQLSGRVQALTPANVVVKGVAVYWDTSTQLLGNTRLDDIEVGDILSVSAQTRSGRNFAQTILLQKTLQKRALKGRIEAIDAVGTVVRMQVGGQAFVIDVSTALADVSVAQQALNIGDFNIGDYVVASIAIQDGEAIARTLQRTQEVKARLYDGTDVQPDYDWGFDPDPTNIPANDNYLYACVIQSVREITLVGIDSFEMECYAEGLTFRVALRGPNPQSKINVEGEGQLDRLQFGAWLTEQLDAGRMVHMNLQADDHPVNDIRVYADQMYVRLGMGREILPPNIIVP